MKLLLVRRHSLCAINSGFIVCCSLVKVRAITSDYITAENCKIEDLQCQICLGTLSACVMLEPCGHSWCATCLSQHFASLLQVSCLLGLSARPHQLCSTVHHCNHFNHGMIVHLSRTLHDLFTELFGECFGSLLLPRQPSYELAVLLSIIWAFLHCKVSQCVTCTELCKLAPCLAASCNSRHMDFHPVIRITIVASSG